MNTINKKQVIEPIIEIKNNNFQEEKSFKELEKRVFNLEKILKEIVCTQSGSKVVTNDLGLKIYSSENKKPQVILNSLIDEITEKYLK